MRGLLLTALFFIAAAPPARPVADPLAASRPTQAATLAAQDEPEQTEAERKQSKARTLLDANGTRALQVRMLDKMMTQFEGLGLPPEFARRFKDRFDVDEILEMNVEIYADKLDEDTLDGLIAFYATPVGQAFAAALPEITDAGLEAGMAYGKRIGEEVGREIGGGK